MTNISGNKNNQIKLSKIWPEFKEIQKQTDNKDKPLPTLKEKNYLTKKSDDLDRSESSDVEASKNKKELLEHVGFYKDNSSLLTQSKASTRFKNELDEIATKYHELKKEGPFPSLEKPIWVQVGANTLMRIDLQKGEIGFIHPPSKDKHYVHTFKDETGAIQTEVLLPIYTSYKVTNKERFKDPDFLKKLVSLNKQSSDEILSTLSHYLGTKPINLPAPDEAPLLYALKTDPLSNRDPKDVLIGVELTFQGKLSAKELSSIRERSVFFQVFDAFNEGLKKIPDDPGIRAHFLKQKNFRQQLYESEKVIGFLKLAGYTLFENENLNQEELESLLSTVNYFEKLKSDLMPKVEKEAKFIEFDEMPPTRQIQIESEKAEQVKPQATDSAKKAQKSSSQASSSNTVEGIDRSNKDPEISLKLDHCKQLLSDLKTLDKGLEELNKWVLLCSEQKIANEEILKGIALVLPLHPREALLSLDSHILKNSIEALDQLAKTLKNFENILKRLQPSLKQEEAKQHFLIAITLFGYLNYALFLSKSDKGPNNYPFYHFMERLKLGVYLQDPLMQQKSAEIAMFYAKEAGGSKTALRAVLDLSENILPHEINDINETFINHIAETTEKQLNLQENAKVKNSSTQLWQKLDLMLAWKNLVNLAFSTFNQRTNEVTSCLSALKLAEGSQKTFQKEALDEATHVLKKFDKVLFEETQKFCNSIFSLNEEEQLEKIEAFLSEKEKIVKEKALQAQPRLPLQINIIRRYQSRVKNLIETRKNYKNSIEKLKKLPIFKEVTFDENLSTNDLQQIIQDKKTEHDQILGDSFSRIDQFDGLEALYNAPHKESAEKINNFLSCVGLKDAVQDEVKVPTDKQVTAFFLAQSDLASKKKLLGDFYPTLNFAYRSIATQATPQKLPPNDCLGDGDDEISIFDRYKDLNQFSENRNIYNFSNPPSTHNFLRYNEGLTSFKPGNNLGYQTNLTANEVANVFNVSFYSTAYSVASSITKQLLDVSVDKKDKLWKVICFVAKNPQALSDQSFFDAAMSQLFDFQSIQSHIESELDGVNTLVSQDIPKIIKKTLDSLQANIINSDLTSNERRKSATSLKNLLLVSNHLLNYLKKANELAPDDKKIDLGQYQDYLKIYSESLLRSENGVFLENHDIEALAESYLNNITKEELLAPEKQEINLFCLAALHFKDNPSIPKEINDSLTELKSHERYGQIILEIYFRGKVPEGLTFDPQNQIINYREIKIDLTKIPKVTTAPFLFNDYYSQQKRTVYETQLSLFTKTLNNIGFHQNATPWYASDPVISSQFRKLTGKSIDLFNVSRKGEFYFVEGTPYLFNEGKNLFFQTPNGATLTYLPNPGKPLEDFGLGHRFQTSDQCFQDDESGKIVIYRQNEPTYTVANGGEIVIRENDQAVAFKGEGPTVWYVQSENSEYQPYSVEYQDPLHEFKYTTTGEKTRFESTQHPGYFLTENQPICKNVNLKNYLDNAIVLENQEGAQIVLASNGVEFAITDDRISTKNPWDLLDLLLKADDEKLISAFASTLFLTTPANPKEQAIADRLTENVSKIPKAENFSSWIELTAIDRSIHGNHAAISSFSSKEMKSIFKTYTEYRALARLRPEIKASSENERIFLNESLTWLKKRIAEETESIKQQKKTGNGKNFFEKLIDLFTPNINRELAELKTFYNVMFEPLAASRFEQLQTGSAPKNKPTLRHINPISFSNLKHLIRSQHEELISKFNQGVPETLPNFKELQGLFENEKFPKEFFAQENILSLYHAAKSATKEQKKELIDWLELSSKEDEVCNWLTKVAKNPGRFPSLEKLQKNKEALEKVILTLNHAISNTQKLIDKTSNKIAQLRPLVTGGAIWNVNPETIKSHKKELKEEVENLKKLQETQKKLERRIFSTQENYEKNLKKSLSTDSLWKVLKFGISSYLKAKAIAKEIQKPLRLKNLSLSRPYATFKISQAPLSKSPILDIDNGFNKFFNDLKEEYLNTQKPTGEGRVVFESENPSLESAKKEHQEYIDLEMPDQYTLKGIESSIETLEETIENEIKAWESKLKTIEFNLISLVNLTVNSRDELLKALKGKRLEWKDIVKLMNKNQEYAFKKHLSEASPETIEKLQNGFYRYLTIRTRLYQMDRIKKTLSDIRKEDNKSPALIQRLGEQLSEKRAYTGENPEDLAFLFFEAASPKGFYRKEQYQMVQDAQKSDITLAQMATGAGKTDYVLPMIMKRHEQTATKAAEEDLNALFKGKAAPKVTMKKSDIRSSALKLKNHLKIAFWPKANYQENTSQISSKITNATGQQVFQLKFTRESHLDSAQLELLLLKLERAAQKGDLISVKTADIASIQLHWIETLEEISQNKSTPELLKCAEFYGKIVQLLYTSSFATIDEAHDLLDPLQKTIYTLGNYEQVPDYSVNFATDLYDILLENNTFKTLVEENKALTPDAVNEKFEEILDNATLQKIAGKIGIGAINIEEFKEFLIGGGPLNENWKKVEGAKKLLYLAKGYSSLIIKAAISGAVSEHFGLSIDHYDTCKCAIPYERKDIPKESKDASNPSTYQNIEETLFKTLRTYHTIGLSKENQIDLFKTIVKNYRDELNYNKKHHLNKPRNEYPSYIILNNLLEKIGAKKEILNDLLAPQNLSQLEARIAAILNEETVELLKKDPLAISNFVRHIASKDIKIYPKTIGVNPQDLIEFSPRSVSVTATPQETKTHSLKTLFQAITGSSGKLFDLLLTKTVKIKQMAKEENTFIDNVAAACKKRNARAIADPSGLKTFDLPFVKKMAASLNKNDSKIKYIVYFDSSQKAMRFDTQSKTSQPFTLKNHHPETTLTLYDQAHSTGTDIFQSPNAKLILLVGEATTSLQAGQGAGRMRQLDKAQNLEAWTTFTPPTGDMANSQLLEKLLLNNMSTSLNKNKVALIQLMQADLKGALKRKMLGLSLSNSLPKNTLDVSKMLSAYKKYSHFFITNTPYNPEENYGSIGKPVSPQENLEKAKKGIISQAEANLGLNERKQLIQKLNSYEFSNIPLPKNDIGTSNVDASQEVSASTAIQKEASIELNVEVNHNLHREVYTQTPNFNWNVENNWPKTADKFFKINFNTPTSLSKRVKIHRLNINILRHRTKMYSINPFSSLIAKFRLSLATKEMRKLEKSLDPTVSLSEALAKAQKDKEKINKAIKRLKSQEPSNLISKSYNKKSIDLLNEKLEKTAATEAKLQKAIKAQSVRFVRAKEAMPMHLPKELAIGVDFFEDNFLLSSNYSDQLKINTSPIFNSGNIKPLTQILLIQDLDEKGTPTYTAVAVDSHDSTFLHKLFELDREKEAPKERKRKMALVSLDLHTVVDQGRDKLSSDELNDPAVFALTAQAKLISGRTDFTDEEEKFFKARAKQIDKASKGLKMKKKKADTHQKAAQILSALSFHASPPDVRQNRQAIKII